MAENSEKKREGLGDTESEGESEIFYVLFLSLSGCWLQEFVRRNDNLWLDTFKHLWEVAERACSNLQIPQLIKKPSNLQRMRVSVDRLGV